MISEGKSQKKAVAQCKLIKDLGGEARPPGCQDWGKFEQSNGAVNGSQPGLADCQLKHRYGKLLSFEA